MGLCVYDLSMIFLGGIQQAGQEWVAPACTWPQWKDWGCRSRPPTGVRQRTAPHAQPRSGGNGAGSGGKAISMQEEGADMRLEDTKGELHLCLLSLFCECTYECGGY